MMIRVLKELRRSLRLDPYICANRGRVSTGGSLDHLLFGSLTWQLTASQDETRILQVGAHCGAGSHDFKAQLQQPGVSALLVEPQPDVFVSLSENFADLASVRLANVAVSRQNETRKMYRIADFAHQFHVRGKTFGTSIASFDPEHPWQYFLRNATEAGKQADRGRIIETVDVEAVTLSDLTKRESLSSVDILAIDTEGFDFEVLKMAFEAGFRPSLIRYEHKHLADAEEMRASWKMLVEKGYQVVVVAATGDSVAWKDRS